MAHKCREDIVGKRFLSLNGYAKLRPGRVAEWGWRAGVVRAATHKDNSDEELQVLVEYDNVEWHRREWISVYKVGLFHFFLIEQGLSWSERNDPYSSTNGICTWPALTFSALVSSVDITSQLQPVEFLPDRALAFKDYKQLKPFQDWDPSLPGVKDYPDLRTSVRRWREQQDGQRILLTTPSVLVGYRVEVYRAEGTTQWYTAVIVGYNEATKDLTVTDDTVLEEHNEDPALVQMRLIGDGVVESIMRGENVGITPRRSRSTVLQTHQQQQQQQQQLTRVVRGGITTVDVSSNPSPTVTTVTTNSAHSGSRKLRASSAGKALSPLGSEPIVVLDEYSPPSVTNLSGNHHQDKGSISASPKSVRKRKVNENESAPRTRSLAGKEDLENKQSRKKNVCKRGVVSSKKKVLEEANNSKLREVEIRVEDCLLQGNDARSGDVCGKRPSGRDSCQEQQQQQLQKPQKAAAEEHQQQLRDVDEAAAPPGNENGGGDSNDGSSSSSSSPRCLGRGPEGGDVDDEQRQSSSGSPSPSCDSPTTVVVVAAASEEDRAPATQPEASDDTSTAIAAAAAAASSDGRDRSSRGDDDGLPSSSSPFSRMELAESGNTTLLGRFPDDRSDSGVSSLRSGSGDERSGSRSSALSSSDEPQPPAPQGQIRPNERSPLFVPAGHPFGAAPVGVVSGGTASEPVRVWRDPSLLLESEPHVRHIHSVQHQSLLMSHPSTPAVSGPPSTSASGAHPAASLYPPVVPPPNLMSPHPLQPLPPPGLYSHHLPEMLWKQRYSLPIGAAPLLPPQGGHPAAEELLERERVYAQDRLLRERQSQENRELEKQQKEREHKERERLERERQEREKLEREKQEKEREQERERQEKQKAEQAVHKHFEESLRRAHQKQRDQGSWNLISLPPPQRSSNNVEEDRKRFDQDIHQRHIVMRTESRERYYPQTAQRTPSISQKPEYPPPAHSRIASNKVSDKLAPHSSKAEVNVYGYPAYQPNNVFFGHDPKNKLDHHKQPLQNTSGLVVTKTTGSSIDRDREILPNPPPLLSELKNSVIVKNETKSHHHLDSKGSIAHSPSPKLRTAELMGHYLPSATSQSHKTTNLYEYRTTQSPHHLSHSASPHHHLEGQNLGKTTPTHRSQNQQLLSPHHHRMSPHSHPHIQSHPSPELRYRNTSVSDSQTMYPGSGKGTHMSNSFSYLSSPTAVTVASPHHGNAATGSSSSNSKPKVSSPAPHHIYGKPSAGIGSGIPVARVHEAVTPPNAIPLTSKTLAASVSPSPFQQMSQYHPPLQPQTTSVSTCFPPPAHSTRTSTSIERPSIYDRMYPVGTVASSISAKPLVPHHGTSPPTAASAPSPVTRPPLQQPYCVPGNPTSQTVSGGLSAVQTQPLDLGVSSNKYEMGTSPKRKASAMSSSSSNSNTSPMCLEIKKRRVLEPNGGIQTHSVPIYVGNSQPQLARVSEPSPLIVSAATTITTVVNTAAYRSPPVTTLTTHSTLTESLADVSVTAVTISSGEPPKSVTPESSILSVHTSTAAPSAVSPTPTITSLPNVESPTTPIKANASSSAVDSEKSNSPGPTKINYPVRHLKKAWLQRHTGEDLEDTTGVVGSGSCVTLPININLQVKDSPVSSLHNVGSMAVNSISKTKPFSSKTNNRKGTLHKDSTALNGHPTDLAKGDDSSSSDQDRGRKSPPKRKPPKVKRKKGGGGPPKKANADDNSKKGKNNRSSSLLAGIITASESEKESGSENDSDSGASSTVTTSNKKSNNLTAKEPKKRGRRPKSSKNDKGEEPRPKKAKDENSSVPLRDPFRKPPVGQLKKTGESFLQDGPCFEVAPKLAKCRECRWTPNQRSKNMPNIFCRFYAFRRLRYTKNGQLAIAGFSDPHKDASEEDLKLWLPSADSPPPDLDLETSRFLLKQVGDHFCDLLVQEKEAHAEHMSDDKTVAWKRVVQGVREMCDVCETTLFNFHWACGKCGFVVCLDCYKSRKNGSIRLWGEASQKDRDDFSWLLCTNRQAHEQEKLMLTQIIAGDSLFKLGRLVHEMRELWSIEQYCGCPLSKDVAQKSNSARKEIIKSILSGETNGIKKEIKEELDLKSFINGATTKEDKHSYLSWLADVALSNEDKKESCIDGDDSSSSDSSSEEKSSTLRDLLMQKNVASTNNTSLTTTKPTKKTVRLDTLDDVISSVIEDSVPKNDNSLEVKSEMKHFIRRYNWQNRGRKPLPIRIMTLTDGKELYPDTPHSWLCDGKLLRLSDPIHKSNYKIFQDQWKRGQPVLVSDVAKLLSKDLWNPEAFARDFGEEKNDLVNCMNGNLVPNQPMRKFWEGFEHFSKRLKDEKGNPMLLKLKDWPPGEDFAELLPTRFNDLMKVLPLSEYTHRTGKLNLASRLPECFVRPDLGPKMYNAYGSALYPTKGTTNLHLDISDAVNMMVYVGIPKDSDSDAHIKEAFRAIDEAGCDILTRRRVRDKGELPGALWHIYNARDADKIRDLLNKIVVEKGGILEPHHDPIHDQSCYLDENLRLRLYKEYGVEGYAIVQCLGDAVFIPAGAPHQVRNLHNCIKVAEDFVSPENVAQCFHLTHEFRDLSDTHSNHEDKLQIKNIIYHAVKDSLSALTAVLNKHLVKKEKDVGEHNGTGSADNSLTITNSNKDSSATEPA